MYYRCREYISGEDFAFLEAKTYNRDVTLYLNSKILSYISSVLVFTWLLNEIAFVTSCALSDKKTFAYTFCSQDVEQNKKWSTRF